MNPNGRTPPHSIEAEEYLLSCCFLDGADVIAACIEAKLTAKAFYSPANRVIFEKLLDLYARGLAIDLQILFQELQTSRQLDEIGGLAYLTQVSGRVPTTAQVGYFITEVREKYLLRELIKACTGGVESCYAYDGQMAEFVDKLERDIFSVTQERIADGARHVGIPMKPAMEAIHLMLERKGALTGVASGFKDLDSLTYGFKRQEMIVIAARPSMGKTSLALNIAEHVTMPTRGAGLPVLVFSLEMSAEQLCQRFLCSRARVNQKLLRDGLLSKKGEEMQRLAEAQSDFGRSSLFIDESSSPTVMEIRAKARRLHQKKKLGLIIVDYLQLIGAIDPRAIREQQVAEMSRGLKAMAKELDVPVIVLSQLNRAADKENRTPRLSDLRESGAIEQDADVVMFLARPKDADEKFQVAADMAELILAKNRNGPVGDLRLSFLRDITRFENYTQ